jgi:acyl carrier protein
MEAIRTMDKESIIEKINGFLVDEFEVDPEKISPEANLRDTLGLDSLDYIDLGVVIESNFGFKVKHEDFAAIDTFQSLYDYIFKRTTSQVVS